MNNLQVNGQLNDPLISCDEATPTQHYRRCTVEDLKGRFKSEMVDIYERAKEECGYNATRFRQMVERLGGLEAAQALLRSTDLSDGFTALWELGRLDLTVEALVLRDPWKPLFTDQELEVARRRLADLGYNPTQ